MSQPHLAVTVSRTVPVSPESLYALVADVGRVGEYSPETVSARWLDDGGPAVGARFRGRNRIGFLRWSTVATVVAAEPGRRFAFEVAAPSRSTWSYTFADVDGGTLVTESMSKQDPQPAVLRWMQRLAGVTDREDHLRAGMTATLARLDSAATAAVAISGELTVDYMFLIHTDAGAVPLDPATEGFDEMMSAWWVYNRMLVDGGHFVSGGSLRPADTATTVSTSTGAVTDGPFVETKEDIGGFYVVRADDLDQALELARAIPVPASVEVRPLMYRPDA